MMSEDGAAGERETGQFSGRAAEQPEELNFLEGASGGGGGEEGRDAGLPPDAAGAGGGGGVVAKLKALGQWVSAQKTRTLKGVRPWREFAKKSEFSVPKKSEVWQRLTVNLKYYYSNYFLIVIVLAAWTAISNWFFVVCMALGVSVYYYYRTVTKDGSPFMCRGKEVSALQFNAGFAAASLFLFWLSGGSSVIFWLLVSVVGVIGGHGATREPVSQMDLVTLAIEESQDDGALMQDTFNRAFGSAV
eukprot:Hpha_TRINITY_DN17526_c0_g1::TRINITY_DN17526_c0_g1_i1::g.92457::m.92457/K20359/RABAC1, PRAF1; PRA1 family protein 1